MQQLPWRLLSVVADGRCALHATAVACGHRSRSTEHDVCDLIKSDLTMFYEGTEAARLISRLYRSGAFEVDERVEGFGDAHIANPLYFKDFLRQKSPWIQEVVSCECESFGQVGLSSRDVCPHHNVVSFIHRRLRHSRTTTCVSKRDAVIFLNNSSHWYVLIPYERSVGL